MTRGASVPDTGGDLRSGGFSGQRSGMRAAVLGAVLAVAERSVEWLEDAADLPDTPIRLRDTGREPADGA